MIVFFIFYLLPLTRTNNKVNIKSVYTHFKTKHACMAHLELVLWNDIPVCPYCRSERCSSIAMEKRYHCNNCNTTFSVTVGTIFHKTKMDLQKWFFAAV